MKTIKLFFILALLQFQLEILPQEQSIFIFDPAGVSTSFQYTLSQLTQDPVFVADSLDDSIHNYDALFLFMNYPFILSQDEGALLTEFATTNKPIYIYSDLVQDLDSVDFWNYIGVDGIEWLLISVFVDSVTGTETSFLENIKIDTSFWSGAVPVVSGNVEAVLVGHALPIDVFTAYIPSDNTLRVIVDLFNLIDDEEYLKRVLEYFELQPPNYVDEEIISLTEFVLSQNYPNPFNPVTKIGFTISDFGFVSLKVYDILGNEIATLVNEEKQPGVYEVEFSIYSDLPSGEGRNLTSGIYFYQLLVSALQSRDGKAGDYTQTRKMILLK